MSLLVSTCTLKLMLRRLNFIRMVKEIHVPAKHDWNIQSGLWWQNIYVKIDCGKGIHGRWRVQWKFACRMKSTVEVHMHSMEVG